MLPLKKYDLIFSPQYFEGRDSHFCFLVKGPSVTIVARNQFSDFWTYPKFSKNFQKHTPLKKYQIPKSRSYVKFRENKTHKLVRLTTIKIRALDFFENFFGHLPEISNFCLLGPTIN